MDTGSSPAFGQADLSNCEREQIQLAGAVQPHGVLLVLREPGLLIVSASANAEDHLGWPAQRLDGQPLAVLGPALAAQVQALLDTADLTEPQPLPPRCQAGRHGTRWHGLLHRVSAQQVLVLELEPAADPELDPGADPALLGRLSAAVQRFSQAASIGALSDAMVRSVRELTGHDRVMVYKFDPDGHGKIIAEARDPRLAPLLGHHYPASDIPQQARALYLRNRVRVLVDVHYQSAPLVPPLLPVLPSELAAAPLDMSMCGLRSMSPLHIQYLKNMGVAATLVVSLVREGKLWGLIAAHHDTPRTVCPALRAACDMLAEVASTRIAAIENYAYAQVAILVRRIEQRLVEATSTEGDWRQALLRNPRTLLQPLEANGAVLCMDGELLTTGEVPSTPELRALLAWVADQHSGPEPWACSSVAQANPALASLTPLASGVLAVRLSTRRPDYLLWLRKEQLLTVTWAGDPAKPMVNDDPLTLSPRRSFAAWSEIVRGTALPWSGAEQALARAVGHALVDIVVQVNAVRLLVAEHQLSGIRGNVNSSGEPVAIADAQGRLLFANPVFTGMLSGQLHRPAMVLGSLDDVAAAFTDPAALQRGLDAARSAPQAWRGELALRRSEGPPLPVAVRAEQVPGRDGQRLGLILVLADLSDSKDAELARSQLEQSLLKAVHGLGVTPGLQPDEMLGAIVTNASLAAMDIADNTASPGVAALLRELDVTTHRAAGLYRRIRQLFSRQAG